MPPPSKGTSFAFKTNADFRRMLETPRPQRFQEGCSDGMFWEDVLFCGVHSDGWRLNVSSSYKLFS